MADREGKEREYHGVEGGMPDIFTRNDTTSFYEQLHYTVIPLYSGHLRDLKNLSAIANCPL